MLATPPILTLAARMAVDPVCHEKRFHRLGVYTRDKLLGRGDLAWAVLAPRDRECRSKCCAQHFPLGGTVGPVSRGAEGFDLFAVGPQPRDIDPVERGTAHQTDRITHGPVPPVELDAGPDTPRSL